MSSSPEPPRLDAGSVSKRKPRGPNRVKLSIHPEWQACAAAFDVTVRMPDSHVNVKAVQRSCKALTSVLRCVQSVTHMGTRSEVIRAACDIVPTSVAGLKAVGVFELRNEARTDDVVSFVCESKLGVTLLVNGVRIPLCAGDEPTTRTLTGITFHAALAVRLFAHCLSFGVEDGSEVACVLRLSPASSASELPAPVDWLAILAGFVDRSVALLADRMLSSDKLDSSPYTAPRKRHHSALETAQTGESIGPVLTLMCDTLRALGWSGCKVRAQLDFWSRNLRLDKYAPALDERYGIPSDDESLELALVDLCNVVRRCSTITMKDMCQQVDTWK